jgi:phospholipase/lecithinase/hemolysin
MSENGGELGVYPVEDGLQSRIIEWNTRLEEFAAAFRARHCSVSVSIYDTSALMNKVLDDPEKYGFKDSLSSCHSEECIWYDGIHITFAMHKILAHDIANFLTVASQGRV